MDARTRLLNTIAGKPVDRVPVYTQIPFGMDKSGFVPRAFHGYNDYDNWRENDQLYSRLVKRMEKACDNFFIWRPSCMQPENFFIHRSNIKVTINEEGTNKQIVSEICLNGRIFEQRKVTRKGSGHSWEIRHFCSDIDQALQVIRHPWFSDDEGADEYEEINKKLNTRGVIWLTIPSPLLVACRIFDPQEFLILILSEKKGIDLLMKEIQERIHANLEKLLKKCDVGIVRFGGAEHATPPLMSPDLFDHFVVGYDQPLIDLCKRYNRYVAVHCHGNIRHALKEFVKMGVDQTDPVETIPDGNITLEEARMIADSKITLTGNIQMRELENESEDYIKNRVEQIIHKMGPDKLIISTTGTPLQKINEKTFKNYNALMDAVYKPA